MSANSIASLCILGYGIGMWLAYFVMGIFGFLSYRMDGNLRFGVALVWPASLCVWILWTIANILLSWLLRMFHCAKRVHLVSRACDAVALMFSPYEIGLKVRKKCEQSVHDLCRRLEACFNPHAPSDLTEHT